MKVSLKVKHTLIIWLDNSLLTIYTSYNKNIRLYKHLHTDVNSFIYKVKNETV